MLLTGKTVLIIEDEFLIALDVEDTLNDEGATVLGPANSSEQAIQLIKDNTISAALLDLNLVDGLTVKVAKTLERHQVPFVYHTGQTEILSSSQWPAAPVLNKPSSPTQLIATIVGLLRTKLVQPEIK